MTCNDWDAVYSSCKCDYVAPRCSQFGSKSIHSACMHADVSMLPGTIFKVSTFRLWWSLALTCCNDSGECQSRINELFHNRWSCLYGGSWLSGGHQECFTASFTSVPFKIFSVFPANTRWVYKKIRVRAMVLQSWMVIMRGMYYAQSGNKSFTIFRVIIM